MTRKEKIIEILERHYGSDVAADEILALPLDTPSREEISIEQADYTTAPLERAFYSGAKWAIDEIIKRNTK